MKTNRCIIGVKRIKTRPPSKLKEPFRFEAREQLEIGLD
jgi:hypothetical protein